MTDEEIKKLAIDYVDADTFNATIQIEKLIISLSKDEFEKFSAYVSELLRHMGGYRPM